MIFNNKHSNDRNMIALVLFCYFSITNCTLSVLRALKIKFLNHRVKTKKKEHFFHLRTNFDLFRHIFVLLYIRVIGILFNRKFTNIMYTRRILNLWIKNIGREFIHDTTNIEFILKELRNYVSFSNL